MIIIKDTKSALDVNGSCLKICSRDIISLVSQLEWQSMGNLCILDQIPACVHNKVNIVPRGSFSSKAEKTLIH